MKKRILIGIAGGSGSGKTAIAQKLSKDLGHQRVVLVAQDSYYKDLSHLPLRERAKQNFDHPDALDNELLIQHLKSLLAGQVVEQPVYDFSLHCRSRETVRIGGQNIIILEGVLILVDKELRQLMDIKVYVDTDADIRFIRRLKRDILERGRTLDSVIEQYEKTVRPMHLKFVEPSKRYADVIISGSGEIGEAVALLSTKIEALLRET
ncbi:MAG TPA: uridine kinase [Bacteroidetes bacterium]|nr:uridine kinase [Bacteroidota bacterium]